MSEAQKFSFGDNAVAIAYDNVLVPILFEPWAARLVEEHQPWEDRRVLDLATGTGVVARMLADRVGPGGNVLGIDPNAEMLALARQRCDGLNQKVEFVESPAHPLDIPGDSVDVVVCQQGIQFFPDRRAAAGEIYRILRAGGKVIATTWRPVSECQFFGAICEALEAMGEAEISGLMRVPFDIMPEDELKSHFESNGFRNVDVSRQEQDLTIEGGISDAVQVAYATPIGPKLRAMPGERQEEFRNILAGLLRELSDDGTTMGCMVTNVLTAEKPA